MIVDFGRDVDDVAEAGGLFGDLLCTNGNHAAVRPSVVGFDQC
jgi:hypothetical protein